MTGFEPRTSVSEATALPTAPQPLPKMNHTLLCLIVQVKMRPLFSLKLWAAQYSQLLFVCPNFRINNTNVYNNDNSSSSIIIIINNNNCSSSSINKISINNTSSSDLNSSQNTNPTKMSKPKSMAQHKNVTVAHDYIIVADGDTHNC